MKIFISVVISILSISAVFSQNPLRVEGLFYMNNTLYKTVDKITGESSIALCMGTGTLYSDFFILKVIMPKQDYKKKDLPLTMMISLSSIENSGVQMKLCEKSSCRSYLADTLVYYAFFPEELLLPYRKILIHDLEHNRKKMQRKLKKIIKISYCDTSKRTTISIKTPKVLVLYDEQSQIYFLKNCCECIIDDDENVLSF